MRGSFMSALLGLCLTVFPHVHAWSSDPLQERLAANAVVVHDIDPAAAARAERVDELRELALEVRTLDPMDEAFSDLRPLVRLIGDARVVALGESSHGDGNCFRAKARLIKFLHQEMGFDVIAWEAPQHATRLADRLLSVGVDAALEAAVLPGWMTTNEAFPLVEYVHATRNGADRTPISMAGFDCMYDERYLEDLFAFLDAVIEPEGDVDEFHIGRREREDIALLVRACARARRVDGEFVYDLKEHSSRARQRLSLVRTIDTIDARRTAFAAVHGELEVEYWLRTLRNVLLRERSAFAALLANSEDGYGGWNLASRNLRDRAMGETLVWLANEVFPDRKLIVWAATYHSAVAAGELEDPRWPMRGTVSMGDVARRALGDSYYSIGCVAGEGAWGLGKGYGRIEPAGPDTLDGLLMATGMEHSYLPLRGLPPVHWLRERLVSRHLRYGDTSGSWPDHLDGIFFTRTERPVSRLTRPRSSPGSN